MLPTYSKSWSSNQLVEISLPSPEAFLKVKETLGRIGVQRGDDSYNNILRQVCYILFKRGKYYIVHTNELRRMDKDPVTVGEDDIAIRNLIIRLLSDWGLLSVVHPDSIKMPVAGMGGIIVVKHPDKHNWKMIPDYTIGVKKKII